MSDIPEGAQRSEDGQWWWDGAQWQPVSGQQSGSGQGELNEREAARVAAGLPAKLDALTAEQRQQYVSVGESAAQLEESGEAEVLAMSDTGSESGETVA